MASQDIDCHNLSEKEWDRIPKTCPALAMFEPSECSAAWSQLWGVQGKGSADSDRGPITTICSQWANSAAAKADPNDDEDEVRLQTVASLVRLFSLLTLIHLSHFLSITLSLSPPFQEVLPMDFCDICGLSNHEDKLLICENCVTG